MQLYTVYFICKLLYMFQVFSPPIIRSTNSLFTESGTSQPLMLDVAIAEELRHQPLLLPVTIVEELRQQRLTSTRFCKYSYLCS